MKIPEKAENMDLDNEADDDDDDYFNPNICFICKLCRKTFPSVKELLSHKRSQHTKNELKGIHSIIFEERFNETKLNGNLFSISADSNAISSKDTVEFISDQHQEVKSCESNDSSLCSESEKVALSSAFVRVTRLTFKEINSLLNVSSCPVKIDELDGNIITQNNIKNIEITDCAVNFLESDAADENSSTPAIKILNGNQDFVHSSPRKSAVSDDLPENQISELVQDDEIVDLSGPYVRLEKLTAKQIESKLKSRSTVNPDISELSSEDSAELHISTTSEPNTSILPFKETKTRPTSSSQNLETWSKVLNTGKHFNLESHMCSGCGQVFNAVDEVEDHEKKCRLLPRNRNKKPYLKNNSVVTLSDPLKFLKAEKGETVQEIQREDVQVVYEKVKDNSEQEKKIPPPIDKSKRSIAICESSRAKLPSLPRPTRGINSMVSSIQSAHSSSTNNADDESSIEKQTDCQKQFRYSDGTLNVILFSNVPASSWATSEISTENRRICKLCSTELLLGEELQNHCENCYLHNKDRHIHCISCNKNFPNPQQLNFHLMNIHFTPENLPGNSSGSSRIPVVDNFENNPNEEGDLPLAEWLVKRKQNFPDVILLDPDPTQPKFQLSCSVMEFGIKCKLCNAKVKSEIGVKRHVAVCWAYNKIYHSFCAWCKTGGWKPELLLKHRQSAHSGKLLPLPPFFCIECKQEFGTQAELNLHQKSLNKFCENRRMAVYTKKMGFVTTSPTTANAPVASSTLPSTVGSRSDKSCLIYLATNIFEEPDARAEAQCKVGNPNIQNVSCTNESRTGVRNTMGTTRGLDESEVVWEKENQNSSLVPQVFCCAKCKQFFYSAFALKCHNDPQYMNSTIHTIQECVNQQTTLSRGQSSQSCPKECTTLEGDTVKSTPNVIVEGEKTGTETLTADDEDDVQISDKSLLMEKGKVSEGSQEKISEPSKFITDKEAATTVSLADWLKFQKDRGCSDPDGSVNVILLDPDLTSTAHAKSFKISTESPVTCKLCLTNLETEPDLKNHAANCWLHNKDRHIFCITCKIPFKHPMQLRQHYTRRHSDSNSDTKTADNNKDAKKVDDTEAVNKNDLDHDLDLDIEHLTLGEWIENRKKYFPDIILVDPDPNLSHYLSSYRSVKLPTRSSASASLMCQLCTFKCVSENEMKCHLQICWTYNKRNHCYCIPCRIYFSSALNLEFHQRVSHEEKTLPLLCCRDCHQGFKWRLDLKEHEDSAQEFFHTMRLDQEKLNVKRMVSSLESSGSISARDSGAGAGPDIYTNSNSNKFAQSRNSNQKGNVGSGRPRKQCTQEVAKKDQNHTRHHYRAQRNKSQRKLKYNKTITQITQNSKLSAKSRKSSCTICDKSFLSQKSLEKHLIMSHAEVGGKTGTKAGHKKNQQVGIHIQCSEKGCKRNYKHYHFAQQQVLQLLKLASINGVHNPDEGPEVVVRKSMTVSPTGEVDNSEEAMEQGEGDARATSSDYSVISNESDSPRKMPKFDTGISLPCLGPALQELY